MEKFQLVGNSYSFHLKKINTFFFLLKKSSYDFGGKAKNINLIINFYLKEKFKILGGWLCQAFSIKFALATNLCDARDSWLNNNYK